MGGTLHHHKPRCPTVEEIQRGVIDVEEVGERVIAQSEEDGEDEVERSEGAAAGS
jgi:hypothetical protein